MENYVIQQYACLSICGGQSHQEIKTGAHSVGIIFRMIMRSAPNIQLELAQGFWVGHFYWVLNIPCIVILDWGYHG